MSKNILVTGGAGYIGSHVCKALTKSGYTPVSYDNLSKGHKSLVKWGPLEIGGISDQSRVEQVIEKYKPDGVIHLAAHAYVGESVKNPSKYYRNNLSGTAILLDTLRNTDVKKIIFSSSCAVYGNPENIPMDENHPLNPINPYGRSKLMVEYMLQDFHRAYSISSVSLRYFNAAGADAELETGELHNPETHLIPLAIAAAYKKISSLNVYGDTYDTSDGTCIRDYIHVSDLADAHVKALEYLEKNNCATACNLSIEKGYSVSQVIKIVEQTTAKKVPFIVVDPRKGDPPVLVGTSEKAQFSLLWKPKYTRLEDIVTTAIEWYAKSII